MAERKEHFEIHASVLFQLGESLITNPVQALLELIKNSYDADSSYCKISIVTTNTPPEKTEFRKSKGWIVVEDDGTGMSLEDIRQGWLTISNSRKRAFKRNGELTARGRTPLGDKGLGRLGTQRLGSNLEMITHKQGEDEYSLAITWDDFRTEDRLSAIAVPVASARAGSGHGTTLIISDLNDFSQWQGDGVRQLEQQLSQLISPYEETREFLITLTADGTPIELAEIGTKVRNAAQIHYDLNFDGVMKVFGKAKLSYFRPGKEPDRSLFQQLVESDNGKELFEFLTQQPGADRFAFQIAKSPWFVSYKQARPVEEFPNLSRTDGKVANPGDFYGVVDYFTLGSEELSQQSIFDSAKQFKNLVSTFSGIRVFRDGFGIRVDRDWLMLGAQQTRGSSWYGLRPQNTLGFIALTARENSQLEETTDREGFKHNAYYDNFFEMLQSFVSFTADAQEFLRRGWNEFRRRKLTSEVLQSYAIAPEELGITLSNALARSGEYRASLQIANSRLQKTAGAATSAMKSVLAQPGAEVASRDLRASLEQLRADIDFAGNVVQKVQKYLDELGGFEKVNRVLQEQIESLREQIQQVHEMVGLGLTAEALTHEMNHTASELLDRSQQLSRHIRARGVNDPRISSFLEYVRSTVKALQKQLQFLAPSLRFVREKRERINLKEFSTELFRHYVQRLAGEPVTLQLGRIDSDFTILMNRGKLIQVLDNLFLNSEYWLKDDINAHRLSRGEIRVEATKPILSVSDNGRGIDPVLESSIFEPFVSGKGKGKGRGLGLYIVRQLLESDDCHIDLAPERNRYDRLFKFEIDLSGVLVD